MEARRSAAVIAERREIEERRVSGEDVRHVARAIDEDPDAAPCLVRERGQLADDLSRRGARAREAAAVEPLESLELARLEARGPSEKVVRQVLRPPLAGTP